MLHTTRRRIRHGAIILLCLCATAIVSITPAHADTPPPDTTIKILPQDGFNLTVEEQLADNYLIVRLNSPAHNWFAGRIALLPTDQPVTIGLSMSGNDTEGNVATVAKWQGLLPMMTYADPTKSETYECYQKDERGRWISSDPFKQGDAKYAGRGKVPEQSVIPVDVAEQFLSTNGSYWQPWREVDRAEAVPPLNIFRMSHHFKYPSATIAMRVPYTVSYVQQVMRTLQRAQHEGVCVDTIGSTRDKRPLQVIRVDAPAETEKTATHRTILVYAREHATEVASSWVAHGVLMALLEKSPDAQRLRDHTTWLIIPVLDPDGSVISQFDNLTEKFCRPQDEQLPPEVLAYTRYIADYVSQGHTLDLAVSLHNVEANECPPVFCPMIDARQQASTIAVNQLFFSQLQHAGYQTGQPDKPWSIGMANTRLHGWCALQFGALALNYEVNDRYPSQRLSLGQMHAIGKTLAHSLVGWCASADGGRWHDDLMARIRQRNTQRTAYWQAVGHGPDNRTNYELLILGY